jgi:hypothetical protein
MTPPVSPEDAAARRAEFQAAMEKAQADSVSIKEKTITLIGKVLTKAQKAKFASMQGKAFDVAQLNYGSGANHPFTASLGGRGGRGPGGGGPGGGPPAPAGAGTTTSATAASASGTAKAANTTDQAKTATKTKTATKPAPRTGNTR